LLADGVDPLAAKQANRQAVRLAQALKLSFREAAERYFNQHELKWRSASHRDEFLRSLAAYAYPTLGGMDVATIDTPDVLRAIEPHWTTKTTTADRVRNRIEAVLDWCVVRGHRPPGTNPARWKGHLDQVLPHRRQLQPVAHHAAMDFTHVPQFVAELRRLGGIAPKALEFLILSAARSGEVVGAQWDEINFDDKVWAVPGSRMKSGRPHNVPLSPAAIDLLRALPREAGSSFVFVGHRPGSPLTKMAMTETMTRLGQRGQTTIHGFRSSFSNWAHEQTAHSAHTIEISLAHNVGTETERAYRRGDMIAKRRQLMEAWSKFCANGQVSADVISLRR
jgi:integrase